MLCNFIFILSFLQICNVVTDGNFCGKTSVNVVNSTDADKKLSKEINFKKPVGVSAIEITDLFTFKQGKTTQASFLFKQCA